MPKVKAVGEDEVFKVLRTGKKRSILFWLNCESIMNLLEKAWKRMITKVTFVGETFTRKPPKYERFIRPMVHVY